MAGRDTRAAVLIVWDATRKGMYELKSEDPG